MVVLGDLCLVGGLLGNNSFGCTCGSQSVYWPHLHATRMGKNGPVQGGYWSGERGGFDLGCFWGTEFLHLSISTRGSTGFPKEFDWLSRGSEPKKRCECGALMRLQHKET